MVDYPKSTDTISFVHRMVKLYYIVLVNLVKLKCLSFGLGEEIMM